MDENPKILKKEKGNKWIIDKKVFFYLINNET